MSVMSIAGRRCGDTLRAALAIALAVLFIGVPFWLVLATAAKSEGDSQDPNLSPPSHWHLASNFHTVLTEGKLIDGLVSSTLIVVPSVLGVLLLASMAAWVLGRRGGRLSASLYSLLISGILMPPAVVTIVQEMRRLDLAETPPGLIIVYTALYLSVATFFMTGFVRTVPVELEESACIDGAGPWRVYRTIVLPLLRPVIATATILITLFAWNDVLYAFFVLGGSTASTMPLNLYQVAGNASYVNNWNLIFAYVVLMSLPLVVVFLVGQRRIVSGLTSGALR